QDHFSITSDDCVVHILNYLDRLDLDSVQCLSRRFFAVVGKEGCFREAKAQKRSNRALVIIQTNSAHVVCVR
ncbi:hypothetical protein PFISCL1PPCAC_9334, partial [Pristionchus fissidentatus]